MSDEVFSTTLAYTKSPKVTKRTSFQDELLRAITARSARQRSSEYSDDFDSEEIVSLGNISDTSAGENSAKKKELNDFHISDDEEKNAPRLSFLKTKKSSNDVNKDNPEFTDKNDEATAHNGCEDMVENSLFDSHNKFQEIEKDKVKPKPRILSIKSMSSAENNSSLETDERFKPLPRPRSMLKKNSYREEKDRLEEKETSPSQEFQGQLAPSPIPSPTPWLTGTKLEAEKKAENSHPEDPSVTSLSPSSLKESLGNSYSPEPGEKSSVKDQNEEFTENYTSLKSNANEDNSVLVDSVSSALEKPRESHETADGLKEEKENAGVMADNSASAGPSLLKSESAVIPSSTMGSTKKTVEDRNIKNKRTTNNRVSSASGRLMTSEFLKKSSSARRSPSATTSSQYLGTLRVLDQKPPRKPSLEPDRADSIRAAVYQEWLEKKNVYLHEMHRIKRIESENLRIQNEQRRAAKQEASVASFEAWKAVKEKEAKKVAARKRLEEKNRKRKTEEENAARKGEALQAFEKWKEKKMEYLKEKNRKEKEYERAKKQKEEEAVAEKKKDNLTAVEKWNEKKEAFFKQKEKEKINEKRKEELKRAEKKDKDKQAMDEYEKWLEKKERQERIERKQKRHSFLENEVLPPWSPPSRTVFSKVF